MYYVCIAYYLENDIRWRLMAYRYFETYTYTIFNNVILIGLELLHFIVIVIWLRSRYNAKYQGAVRTGKRMIDTVLTGFHHMHLGSPRSIK